MQPAYLFNHYNGQYSIGELVDFDAQVGGVKKTRNGWYKSIFNSSISSSSSANI